MMIRRRKKREAERKESEREVAFRHQSKVMRGTAARGFLFASRHTHFFYSVIKSRILTCPRLQ